MLQRSSWLHRPECRTQSAVPPPSFCSKTHLVIQTDQRSDNLNLCVCFCLGKVHVSDARLTSAECKHIGCKFEYDPRGKQVVLLQYRLCVSPVGPGSCSSHNNSSGSRRHVTKGPPTTGGNENQSLHGPAGGPLPPKGDVNTVDWVLKNISSACVTAMERERERGLGGGHTGCPGWPGSMKPPREVPR